MFCSHALATLNLCKATAAQTSITNFTYYTGFAQKQSLNWLAMRVCVRPPDRGNKWKSAADSGRPSAAERHTRGDLQPCSYDDLTDDAARTWVRRGVARLQRLVVAQRHVQRLLFSAALLRAHAVLRQTAHLVVRRFWWQRTCCTHCLPYVYE